MNVGQIYRAALRGYRRQLGRYLILSFPARSILSLLLWLPLQFSSPPSDMFVSTVLSISLLSILLAPPLVAPFPIAGFMYERLGFRSDLLAPFRRLSKLLFPLLGSFIIWAVYVTLGLMLFLLPGFLIYVRYLLTSSVIVVEGEGGYGAIRRGKMIMEGEFRRGAVVVLLPVMAEVLISLFISTPAAYLEGRTSFGGGWEYLSFGFLIPLLFDPVIALLSVFLYLDIRCQKEGLSEEMLRMDFMEMER